MPTGIAIAIPHGYAAFVHPRSGLAARLGVTILNGPGTVDAGYRGEIKVTLINTDATEQVLIRRGDRIAQLVVQRVEQAEFVEVAAPPGLGPWHRRPRVDRRLRRTTSISHTIDSRRRAVSLFKRRGTSGERRHRRD